MAELKPGWQRVKFGDVVRLNKETCKDPAAEGIERVIGLEHLEPGDLRIRSWGNVADGTKFTNRVRPGQVLFGKRRAYQRKVAVADFDAICSGDIYVFETADQTQLLQELLPFICQTDAFFEYAVGTSAGSLSPRTNWKSLAEYEFALPPLEEQRHLTAAFEAARASAQASQDAQECAEAMRRSLLFAWFRPCRGGQDHFPVHWKTSRLGEMGDTQIGIRKHPGSTAGPNMRPYLRVANVLDGYIDLDDVLEINIPAADLERCALREGDILVNKGNSMDLVGRAAIYQKIGAEECYFQDHLIRYRPHSGVLSGYAHAYLQHLLYTLQFTRIAVASTSIATIPADAFERLPFPVPPLAEQSAMVEQLAAINRAIPALEERALSARSMTKGDSVCLCSG